MKLLLTLVCLAVAGFCVFGFMATFEPLEGTSVLAWRIGYGAAGLASLACIFSVWRTRQGSEG